MPVSVLAAEERTSFPLLPWRGAPVAPGSRWESMARMGQAGFPAGGTVMRGSNPLRLAPEGAFGHLSLVGAPVVVDRTIAGIIVR